MALKLAQRGDSQAYHLGSILVSLRTTEATTHCPTASAMVPPPGWPGEERGLRVLTPFLVALPPFPDIPDLVARLKLKQLKQWGPL